MPRRLRTRIRKEYLSASPDTRRAGRQITADLASKDSNAAKDYAEDAEIQGDCSQDTLHVLTAMYKDELENK